MSDDGFKVEGAEQFLQLSKALKAAGALDLRKELHRELRKAGKPLVKETRDVARRTLPQRGGLARLIAKAPQRVQVRTGLDTAGIRLVAGKRRGAAETSNNLGLVAHPVFGRRENWEDTRVRKGWFTDTLNDKGPATARPLVEAAMESIAQQVITKAKG